MRGNNVAMSKMSLLLTAILMVVMATMARAAPINYGDALTKSILFFEGQRSGKLPPSQRMTWRKDSALNDGSNIHVDYILGNNPLGMSYMVGYGQKFPEKIHHRGSTLPSIDAHPQHLGCRDGDKYFQSPAPNPNILTGAVVGGPADNDSFQDSRHNVSQSEPTTYINAPLVGVLAYFKQHPI